MARETARYDPRGDELLEALGRVLRAVCDPGEHPGHHDEGWGQGDAR